MSLRLNPPPGLSLPIFSQVAELFRGGFDAGLTVYGDGFEAEGAVRAEVILGRAVAGPGHSSGVIATACRVWEQDSFSDL